MLQTFPAIEKQVEQATAVHQTQFSSSANEIRHVFMPYRIAPLGAHIDHQGGHVLGRTINTGTVLVYAPLPKPEMQLVSTQFPAPASFAIGKPMLGEHWAQYAQAAALTLHNFRPLRFGLAGVVSGKLIGAGLSSSASVGLAYLLALATVNDISLTPDKLVELDRQLENDHMGLQNGILDQSSIVYGRAHTMLHIDTRQRIVKHIADPPVVQECCWLIIYSGVSRALTDSNFNNRVQECRQAAKWLDPAATILSDIDPLQFKEKAAKMPEILRRRATHFFGEVERVSCGIGAWREGNHGYFGTLMNNSCRSSITQYQSGHETLITLHTIVRDTPGVYGNRFSGGGYGGCIIALAAKEQVATAVDRILTQYRRQWPTLAAKAAVYRADSMEIIR